ncbi:transmembrane protein 272-like [Ptychodera flava]|uniref:transmembrane protein 272-like n=1 Tax=Ptychodera flava TaxID=63121 RepID=UPI003969E0E5
MADEESQKILPSAAPPGDKPDADGVLNHLESGDLATSLKDKISGSVVASIASLVVAGISLSVLIAMIVIGAIYKDQCPAQPNIPIFLIVGGTVTIVSFFLMIYTGHKRRRGMKKDYDRAKCWCGLIGAFLVVWFIAGNVWIYGTRYKPSYTEPNPFIYCHKGLYLFSFHLLNVTYILIFVILLTCVGYVADHNQDQG